MPDPLDRLLDSLSTTAHTTEPPAALLRAVARRRARRRTLQFGAPALALFACVLLLRPAPLPRPAQPGPIVTTRLPAAAAIVLARTNQHHDPEHLLLPDQQSHVAAEPFHLGPRSDPAQIERWVSH